MKSILHLLFISTILFIAACGSQKDIVQDTVKEVSSEYTYESVPNDPMNTRIYTLENGLKVYLTQFKDEPRIQTYIPVRTGSRNDPADATGLAHYLEHMLFKGNSRIASTNWEEEKVLLKKISDLYEKRRTVTDPAERKAIYAEIDKLSYEASSYAVTNEYDKMISAMGAKGTNAWTSTDETVYTNDIPSSELEKWLKLEAARFDELSLRLFHTELEAVYEEFNRSQDNDFRRVYYEMLELLFPEHPYGTQMTIGKGEHLKNPSMEKIHAYFEKYYIPNNMAICLSGDLDFDKTISLVDRYFGEMEKQSLTVPTFDEMKPISGNPERTIYSKDAESVTVAWRHPGDGTSASKKMKMIDMLLSNGQAGLMDINLNQAQKILDGGSSYSTNKDYCFHYFQGVPRSGQSLEEVKGLMMAELDKIKKGDFPDWLMDAVIKDFKYSEMKGMETNRGRAYSFVDAFINEKEWADKVNSIDAMAKLTKAEIVAYANANYSDDNFVTVYKRLGDPTVELVEKPEITPIQINRDGSSEFSNEISGIASARMNPLFLDYKSDISRNSLNGNIPFYYLKNKLNKTFNLIYILEMGSNNDKALGLAVNYLPYLGTDRYSAEELLQEFFKLGLSFDVNSGAERVYVSLSGLEESFEEGLKLFEHILANVEPDQAAYDKMIAGMLKSREDSKTNKRALRNMARTWAKYGENSAARNVLTAAELKSMKPADLVAKIKSLTSYKHDVFYYGTNAPATVQKSLTTMHKVPASLKDYPESKSYAQLDTEKDKIYFIHYEGMAQAQLDFVSKSKENYDPEMVPYAYLFNEFFGAGLSSIVFQEIRESKALAYSAYSFVSSPTKKDEAHYMNAFIGTQVDKLPDAYKAMRELLDNMPDAKAQFMAAKDAVKKKIETERITRTSVFWNWQTAKRRGIDYDIRESVYRAMDEITWEDFLAWAKTEVNNRNYVMTVMTDRANIDESFLKSLGEYEELDADQLFNY